MIDKKITADYKIIPSALGNRYCFYCDLSGEAVLLSSPVQASCQEEELLLAWEKEGRKHFNLCHKCGRWVSNAMYNPDELCCVDCAPWKEALRFCPHCGIRLEDKSGSFCPGCGRRIEGGGRP